jgi:hypothetical protein
MLKIYANVMCFLYLHAYECPRKMVPMLASSRFYVLEHSIRITEPLFRSMTKLYAVLMKTFYALYELVVCRK